MKKQKIILLVLLLLLVHSSHSFLPGVSAKPLTNQYASIPSKSLPLNINPAPHSQDGYYMLSTAEEKPKDADAVIQSLKDIVKQYLDREKLDYEYDPDYEAFLLYYQGGYSFGDLFCTIFLYDDLVSVSLTPVGWSIPEKSRDKVAIFTTLVNFNSFYAFLILDYMDGEIETRSTHLVETGLPTVAEIETIVTTTVSMLLDYGKALNAIVYENQDPFEVYQKHRDSLP